MDKFYSDNQGRGKKENWSNEVAVKSFFLFQNMYYQDADAFELPKWFVEARKNFTKEEVYKMYDEVRQDVLNSTMSL